ncbi:MAG: hypothetical protein V1914_01980 [archaeon]
MEKQTVYAISNKENYTCYKLGKKASYYEFLFSLLKTFNAEIPDLYDEKGKLPDIERKDIQSSYGNDDIEIIEVIGDKRIFLIIKTEQKDKLREFMEKNTEFVKTK